ncbi:unnamed protein product, partial [marine sediment metagenome]
AVENGRAKGILVVEMSLGQMIEDVKLSVEGIVPVGFYGRTGGVMLVVDEIIEKAENMLKEVT